MKRKRPKYPVEAIKEGNVVVKVRYSPNHGTDRWLVEDYSSGPRKRRSFSSLEDARAEASRIARLMASGEAHAARWSGEDAANAGVALEHLRPTGQPIVTACATYARAFEILGGDQILEAARFYAKHHANKVQRTVSEVVGALLDRKALDEKSQRHLGDLRSRLGRFAEDFGTCFIGNITTAEIQEWLDSLQNKGKRLKAETRFNYRKVLNSLFEFAITQDLIEKNPVARVSKPKVVRGDTVVWTPKEMAKLLLAAEDDFRVALAIQAFSGVRSAELCRLTWEDLGSVIKVSRMVAKTPKRRLIDVKPNLRDWLDQSKRKSGPIWPGTEDAYYDAQKKTADRAGVAWKHNASRHSFASYLCAETSDIAKVAEQSGNSVNMIHLHYRELVDKDQALVWFSISPATAQAIANGTWTPPKPENIIPAPIPQAANVNP